MISRGGALLLRGMRWRLTGSILIVLTAAIAMGAAILGPLYLQAGGDSLVRRVVSAAPESATGFTLVAESGRHVTTAQLAGERTRLIARSHLSGRFAAPVTSVLSVALGTDRHGAYQTQLASRTGICSVLRVTSGRCDLGPGDTVLSARSAVALGVTVGATVTVTTTAHTHPVALHVTGVFQVPQFTAPYWFDAGSSYFPFGQSTGAPLKLPQLDDLFISTATAVSLPAGYGPAIAIQTPLARNAVGAATTGQTSRGMAALARNATTDGFRVSTALPGLLAGVLRQRRLMDTIVTVIAVQLVLLAIWVLAAVLLRSADLRRSELRVARLRGFPFSSILAVTVTEPALLCAAGIVLGVVGAWAVIELAAAALFSAGTTVSLDAWVFVGFGAAVLTIGGVLGLSALRLLRGSGLAGASATAGAAAGAGAGATAAGRSRAVLDVGILVLSGVALLAAETSGALASRSDPIAAAAPAVLAVGVSVIALRVVEFLCRRVGRATVDSSAVARFLAVRQIGRRPAALRESRTLVIALCLACFAISAWSVSRSNRSTAATFSIGAPTVVTVTPHGVGLQQAVDTVDPHARFAMAVIQVSATTQDLLAVDSARLAAVASWPAGVSRSSLSAVSRALRPRTAPAVNLPDGTVSVAAGVGASGGVAGDLGRLRLSLWVFNASEGTHIVSLGTLGRHAGSYRASLGPFCPGGCRLAGIGVLPDSGRVRSSGQVTVRLEGITVRSGLGSGSGSGSGSIAARTGTPVVADLSAADWRSDTAGVEITSLSVAVGFVFPAAAVVAEAGATGSLTPPMAAVADHPSVIPVVAGSAEENVAQQYSQVGTLSGQGVDGSPITVRPVLSATALPRVGPTGELADLTLLERTEIDPVSAATSQEVWLGPHAPADAVAELRAAGLSIDRVQRAAAVISQNDHTGPALAYDFMLLAAILALFTVAVSTFGVLAAGTRQRAAELMALEVSGVPRRVLVRSLAVEALIVATPALFGATAGAVGAAIAIPSLPQLGFATTAPLSYALPVLLILGMALAGVLVVLLATALAARDILRRMSPSLLRGGVYDAD